MSEPTCISTPISWPRLETYAAQRDDASIGEHIAACTACRSCLDSIERDVVALPPLAAITAPPRVRWWRITVPAFGALAAAAILVFVLRPREAQVTDRVAIKGVGIVVLDVVRERDGVIRTDVRTFAPGDRWKVIVTCPPERNVSIDVTVAERGADHVDRPLAPAQLVCGNGVTVPGAFTLTGSLPNTLCARIARPDGGASGMACLTIAPER